MEENQRPALDRRSVIKAAGASGAALWAVPASTRALRSERKRHVIVGTGHRARAFQDALWGEHKERNSLDAISTQTQGESHSPPGAQPLPGRQARKANSPARSNG